MSEPDLSALQPLAGGAADPAPAAPRRRVVVRKRPAAVVSVEPAPAPPPAALADGATLADRVWRQAPTAWTATGCCRLTTSAAATWRSAWTNPWTATGGGCSLPAALWTIEHGKATQRRNAEIQLVEAVARWTADVAELLPERMAELRIIVDHGLSHPAPPPRKDGDK